MRRANLTRRLILLSGRAALKPRSLLIAGFGAKEERRVSSVMLSKMWSGGRAIAGCRTSGTRRSRPAEKESGSGIRPAVAELVDLALGAAEANRRIIFYCACEYPRVDG